MNFKKFIIALGALLLLALFSVHVYASGPEGEKKGRLAKNATNGVYLPMMINNVMNYYSNVGDGSLNPFSADNEGFELPIGSGGDCLFEDGIVIGGYQLADHTSLHNLKVQGSTYWHSFQAGKILHDSTADNAAATNYRLYRVRPDINPTVTEASVMAALQTELALRARFESGLSADVIYQQYIDDWNQWPAGDGAPYTQQGAAHIGYNPATDIPGVAGADCSMWHVMNDLNRPLDFAMAGSTPFGIEVQRTIWAYNQGGALGNTIFIKYRIINKSVWGKIDTCYLTQWNDPDLGGSLGYSDDYVACDTNVTVAGISTHAQIGYVYNGKPIDAFYGKAVPAAGFSFFQGPKVPGAPTDTAVFNGQVIKGFKNLHMTGYNFFINGNPTYADPINDNYTGTIEWYNLQQGKIGNTGQPFKIPAGLPGAGTATTFLLSGDPVTHSGWTEDYTAVPADQRQCLTTGPFTFAAGDTQEVVVAALGAQANDRLSSITFLRLYALLAQSAYNTFFVVAKPPAAPVVTSSALDREIILDWGSAAGVAATETTPEPLGYTFEGYDVYQLPGPSFSNPTKIATFDIAGDHVSTITDVGFDLATGTIQQRVLETGDDVAGIKRFIDVKTDVYTNATVVNGTKYYFAVTAYNYNANVSPKAMESPATVITVMPHATDPGTQFNVAIGTNIAADTTAYTKVGLTDGYITANVIDPSRLTGDIYKVYCTQPGATKLWTVYDSTTQTIRASNQANYSDPVNGESQSDPVVDGIQFHVYDPGAAGGINSVVVTSEGGNAISPPKNILFKQSPNGLWSFGVAGAGTTVSTAMTRLNWQNNAGSYDYEVRVTAGGSQYYIDAAGGAISATSVVVTAKMPVEIWNVTLNQRLLPKVLDDDASGTYTEDAAAQALDAGVGSATAKDWERIYVSSAVPYAEPLPAGTVEGAATTILGRMTIVDWAGTGYFPPAGTVVKIITNKPILVGANAFVLKTSAYQATTGNQALAKTDVGKINVFPNPYFGFNPQERDRYNRFVTISHLPVTGVTTIRIFNLAGQLIKTIPHTAASQFETWDLNNQAGLPVAAGMYIVYVDMPGLGTTKTLKVAVIPEQQYLDRY